MKVNGNIFGVTFPNPMKVAQEQELYNLVLEAVNSLSPKIELQYYCFILSN